MSILTNRLVLKLKQAGRLHMQHMQHGVSTLPSLHSATTSLVVNLGAPFRVSNEGDENEEQQDLGNNEHELQEQIHEGQAAPIAEDAWWQELISRDRIE